MPDITIYGRYPAEDNPEQVFVLVDEAQLDAARECEQRLRATEGWARRNSHGVALEVARLEAELAITKKRLKFLERWIESHGQDVPTEDSP